MALVLGGSSALAAAGLPVAMHATPALPAKDIQGAERERQSDAAATLNAPVKGLDGPRGAEIGQGQRAKASATAATS